MIAPLALTMGEPAGIGGELTLKAWHNHRETLAPFFVIDCPHRLGTLAMDFGLSIPLAPITDPADAIEVFPHALPVLEQPVTHTPLGQLNRHSAPAVMKSIERAVELAQTGAASAVVTNPIHKYNLQQAGFAFPGHTEYLAHLSGIDTPPIMMLCAPDLKVVPITIHCSLQDAINNLNPELIIETAQITAQALKDNFGIANPRLAFCGLNPHAGESGAMGQEEQTIITPALEALKAQGLEVSGPLPADTMFHASARAQYDVALGMYHDQVLIPIKTLAFDQGVNTTLGLPFIRTSPDHGTALDIAAKGIASEASLVQALRLAGQLAQTRSL